MKQTARRRGPEAGFYSLGRFECVDLRAIMGVVSRKAARTGGFLEENDVKKLEEYLFPQGFEPWSDGSLAGVRRRVTMTKGALLGDVAKYYADDYIVWRHGGEADRDRLLRTWRPERDVMVHRFVLLEGEPRPGRLRRTRGFLLGLRGFIEVYRYTPSGRRHRGIEDLVFLIEKALAQNDT